MDAFWVASYRRFNENSNMASNRNVSNSNGKRTSYLIKKSISVCEYFIIFFFQKIHRGNQELFLKYKHVRL